MNELEEAKNLLGKAMAPIKEVIEWADYDSDKMNLEDSLAIIKVVQELLDRVVAGEALSCTSSDPLRHKCAGFKDYTCLMPERRKDVCYDRHDAGYWARMYDPAKDEYIKPPAEQPGCPLSDAMGGEESGIMDPCPLHWVDCDSHEGELCGAGSVCEAAAQYNAEEKATEEPEKEEE